MFGHSYRILALMFLLMLSSCQYLGAGFPEVDKDCLEISLQRTACLGSCPDYKVTIAGNGRVVFESTPFDGVDDIAMVHRGFSAVTGVRVSGTYETTIAPDAIDQLLEGFQKARFFSLRDEYRAEVTDSPTYIVSINTGNGSKTVVDYVGRRVGMPAHVTALQDAIDRTAGTNRWIKGTASVVPLLQSKSINFNGILGLELMDAAAERNDVGTMKRLDELGAPVFLDGGPTPLRTAIAEANDDAVKWLIANGAVAEADQWRNAIQQAVDSDNHSAFQALYQQKWIRVVDTGFATKLLSSAAFNADPHIVRNMLKLGANPTGVDSQFMKDPPLFDAANGLLSNDGNHAVSDRRAVVRELLNAGAKVTYCQHDYCKSVLWQVSDTEIAKMLLIAGADPDFKDEEGEQILFNIDDEGVALLLLSRGADMKAVRPADGKTLRGWSEYQKWSQVLSLLDNTGL